MNLHGLNLLSKDDEDDRARSSRSRAPVTRNDLVETELRLETMILAALEMVIMTVKEYVAKQTEHNRVMDAAIDGVAGDIKGLNEKIQALQNSSGVISEEDQKLLDLMEAQGSDLAGKIKFVDDQTPPPTPDVPPPVVDPVK